jgi:Holliday junction DNA helicase RuvA
MIGKLKGVVDSFGSDWAILDVHGVGYVVQCSVRTLEALPRAGEAATLFIETQVREDQIRLIGFASEVEREWFRLMLAVQGVGSKLALSVLGTLKVSDLASAIALQDKATIARAPGVGPKVAARICAELKDKAPALSGLDMGTARLQAEFGDKIAPKPAAEAVSALVNLGYAQAQASAAVAFAMREAGDGAETARLIRLGLKELSR